MRSRASGASVIHVVAQIDEHGDGAQGAKDAARPQRVAHALLHAVALRDLDVEGVGLQAALLEGGDDVIGVGYRFAPIKRGLHLRLEPASVDDGLHQALGLFQALGIDIHQGDGAVL